MTMLEKANAFIAENKDKVDPRYRPRFHAVPPYGWINDPNGFHFDGEYYHLFYQHYPYEPRWNSMHWGHWRSRDLVKWEDMPVAMAPDCSYDSFGCFSGTAKPDGRGGAHILYTGVIKPDDHDIQQQCYAHFDGKEIVKSELNPVMPITMLPDSYKPWDFRDPCLFRAEDGWRAVMAAGRYTEAPHLVCFSSKDLKEWRFEGEFTPAVSQMPECPDVFELDGKTVTLYSCVQYYFENSNNPRPVLYQLGKLTDGSTRFEGEGLQLLDYGTNAYATQSCEGEAGKRILNSWMSSWAEKFPTAAMGHNWSGMMTVARETVIRDGKLCQEPVPALAAYRCNEKHFDVSLDKKAALKVEDFRGKHADIELHADVSHAKSITLSVMKTAEEEVRITWSNGVLTLDRNDIETAAENNMKGAMSMPLEAVQGRIDLRVLVDACTVEVFANGQTITALAFPAGEEYGVELAVKGSARAEMTCWEIA